MSSKEKRLRILPFPLQSWPPSHPNGLCVGCRNGPENLCWDLSLELTEKGIPYYFIHQPSMIPASESNGFILASCWLNNEQQRFSHPYLEASGVQEKWFQGPLPICFTPNLFPSYFKERLHE